MLSFFHKTNSGIYFYQRSVIIVSYFELLCNYPKIPQRKNYKIQGANRFCIFYFRIFSFFSETKSGIYFYQGCVIIVPYFELLCNYPKIPQRKNYEIQGVNRVSKFYFRKIKTVGIPPPLKIFFCPFWNILSPFYIFYLIYGMN